MKVINQVVAFSLELCMLYMLGNWGYLHGKGTGWKYGMAIGLPVLAMVLWGYFAAPKSEHRLIFPCLTVFKVVLFSLTAFVWYKLDHQVSASYF